MWIAYVLRCMAFPNPQCPCCNCFKFGEFKFHRSLSCCFLDIGPMYLHSETKERCSHPHGLPARAHSLTINASIIDRSSAGVPRIMGPVARGDGNGIRGRLELKPQGRRQRRIILSRAYSIGIDPDPNINVQCMFPSG